MVDVHVNDSGAVWRSFINQDAEGKPGNLVAGSANANEASALSEKSVQKRIGLKRVSGRVEEFMVCLII
jgi:hypothetical protein